MDDPKAWMVRRFDEAWMVTQSGTRARGRGRSLGVGCKAVDRALMASCCDKARMIMYMDMVGRELAWVIPEGVDEAHKCSQAFVYSVKPCGT
eukprot:1153851-Pelagomonas_calceolata.AAC.3